MNTPPDKTAPRDAFLVFGLTALVLCAAFLSGCTSKKSQHVIYTNLEQVPAEILSAAEVLGNSLEQDANSRNSANFVAAFDADRLIKDVSIGLIKNPRRMKAFRAGIRDKWDSSLRGMFNQWAGNEVRFKELVLYKGEPALRFRVIAKDNSSFAIFDLPVATNSAGQLKFVNLQNHMAGFDLVEQMRQFIAIALGKDDPSVLKQVFGKPSTSISDLRLIAEFVTNVREGRYAEAIAGYGKVPESLKSIPALHYLYIQALKRSSNIEKYREALKQGVTRFDTGAHEFMLMELYLLEENYLQALDCLNKATAAIGSDAALLALRSHLQGLAGDADTAHITILNALKMEPDCNYVNLMGLEAFLAAKDYRNLTNSMIFLERNARMDFRQTIVEPEWAAFMKSPESAPWRRARPATRAR